MLFFKLGMLTRCIEIFKQMQKPNIVNNDAASPISRTAFQFTIRTAKAKARDAPINAHAEISPPLASIPRF